MNRKKAREIIVLTLYSMELSGNDVYDSVHYILEQNKLDEDKATDYIYNSVNGVTKNKEMIDDTIKKNLENYQLNRLSYLDLAIIRFATYELLYDKEMPAAIVINEAVDITKKYSDLGEKKASAFNNKLLDKIKNNISESNDE